MERIGPYKVTGELGRGGMGVVLRGVDPAIGRQVAIKVILFRDVTDSKERETMRTRLFREAHAAGILSHPGIVTVYYVGEEGETAFIAMEFVDGPTLQKLLSAPQPPGREVLRRVLWQTAVALDYAHSKGIIHRDIKPANIMLDENGSVKICDFGIAKGLFEQSSLTQAGTSLGTPTYMSPQQIQAEPVDHRTDQYSLGVMAYQLLTGQTPYQGDRMPTLVYHIVNDPPPPAHTVNPALSPGVNEVLQKVLAKDPAARYASCSEFVGALLEKWDADPAAVPPRKVDPPTSTMHWGTPPDPAREPAAREIGRMKTTVLPAPELPEPETRRTTRPKSKLLVVGLAAAVVLLGLGIGGWYVYTRVLHRPQPIAEVKPEVTPEVKPPQPQQNSPPAAPSKPPITETNPPPVPPAAAALAIDGFSVEPQTVSSGTAATLKWSVKNATEVKIEPGIGVVGVSGTRSVAPQQATTYTLTAKDANGASKTETVTLHVAASAPAIEEFSTSRSEIQSGQPAVLHWNVSGADEVSIDQGIGTVQLQGTRAVYPTVSKGYVLKAKGPGGSVTKSVQVSVTSSGPPKIVKFSADPSTIGAGDPAVLRWEVTNALEVRIEPDVGVVDAQGVCKVSPQTTTKFKLFATNEKGTFFKQIQIKVR